MSGLVIPFSAQVQLVRKHHQAVEEILHGKGTVDERAARADAYMTRVLQTAGLRVHNAVLTLVAGERGIPPAGAPRCPTQHPTGQ